ncbi:MAG: metal-sulfur cluster assembly factor [Xanthomonadales bacterium]|nr:metal-sulfur cluster assembly factor [Xanthomonadales bacterium]
MTTHAMDTVDRVRRALAGIQDPCMKAAGLRLSILDLGLVREVRIEDGRAEVELALTEPGCPFTHHLLAEVHDRLSDIDGVEAVRARPVWNPPWTPDALGQSARVKLREACLRTERLPLALDLG